jgi:hypothetical protein
MGQGRLGNCVRRPRRDNQAAYRELTTARELWQPARTDPTGDLDGVAALLEVERGRLDVAEPFAVSSVRRWEGLSRLGNTPVSWLARCPDGRCPGARRLSGRVTRRCSPTADPSSP